ncbi:MAG: competence/damage-inducible protein A [Gammaproteobacteria bacterium]|nr:competence/damage-inducible protein A [Gammaproteobacteria bacterium]
MSSKFPTAAFLIIGNEILDGSTKEKNLAQLIEKLKPKGILVKEARVVRDDEPTIVAALGQLCDAYDFVFTSGGIGPTHDDITVEAVAKFFGVDLHLNEEALQLMQTRYEESGKDASYMNDAVKKMAYMPPNSVLIENSISAAPGFQLGKVFVLAGVPSIFAAMLEALVVKLPNGPVMHSASMLVYAGESRIAVPLDELEQEQAAEHYLEIGSYPRQRESNGTTEHFVKVVVRSHEPEYPETTLAKLKASLAELGIDCELQS